MAGRQSTERESICLIGFDSAWKNKPQAPGAICAIHFDGDQTKGVIAPTLASFDAALQLIQSFCLPDAFNLIGFDQPTIVPNLTGCRPVERAVGSVISWLGGGVQPANRQRAGMFDDNAPVWAFLRALQAIDNPERARVEKSGLFIIEVFPALALMSMNPAFFGRSLAPHYNPARRGTFTLDSWQAVVETARTQSVKFRMEPVAQWCSHLLDRKQPRKCDQDKLDSIICMLVAANWRFQSREYVAMIGDLTYGYMVAPVSADARVKLEISAKQRGVPIS